MTKKEERIFENIQDEILVICLITCQKCKKVEKKYHIDGYDFAEYLVSEGWTFKRGKVICGKCAKCA